MTRMRQQVKIGKRIPTFICESEKKVIELWQSPRPLEDPIKVEREYKALGYDCLIILESELAESEREKLKAILTAFIGA